MRKRNRNKLLSWLLVFVTMLSTFTLPATEVKAVTIENDGVYYDTSDPKDFFNKLENEMLDALFAGGHIYFATKGKLATYSSYGTSGTSYGTAARKTYETIGYTITASAGGKSLTVRISTPGDYYKTAGVRVYDGNMEYTVRAIKYDDIVKLCRNQVGESNSNFQTIFGAPIVYLRMDAIVRINLNGEAQGWISSANNKGQISISGKAYDLYNSKDLADLRDQGFSNNFESYTNIEATVNNNPLTLNYHADTKAAVGYYNSVSNGMFTNSSAPSTTAATTSVSGMSISSAGKLNGIDSKYTTVRQFQSVTIRSASDLGLKKTGYYLKTNEEWKDDNGKIYKAGTTHTASEINWGVTSKSVTTNLYANWKPITYTIKYDANGGTGYMAPETHTYDEGYFVVKQPSFTKKGYKFNGWKLVTENGTVIPVTSDMIKSGTGSTSLAGAVSSGTYLRNLTGINEATVKLVAQWKQNEFEFALDPQLPAGKTVTDYTKKFYSVFDVKFSLTKGGNSITSITSPTITGYKFLGYFEGSNDALSEARISNTGFIKFATTLYEQNKTFLGRWEPVSVTVTLDANTVSAGVAANPGTQKVTAVYDKLMPEADQPYKPGFTFKGFFTGKNGTGTQYYNNVMVPQQISTFTSNTTLYAHWVDENKPSATIEMESSTWTNSGDNEEIHKDKDGNLTGDGLINI